MLGFTSQLSQLRVPVISDTGRGLVAPLSQYADLVDRFVELRGGGLQVSYGALWLLLLSPGLIRAGQ